MFLLQLRDDFTRLSRFFGAEVIQGVPERVLSLLVHLRPRVRVVEEGQIMRWAGAAKEEGPELCRCGGTPARSPM